MTQQNASQSSSTARSMPNEMGLGVTPGQQAAEIVAGLRAKLNMTAEAQALVIAAGGQVVEKNFEPKVLVVASKFVAARGVIFSELIEREVSTKPTGTVVEMAAGYSPRGIQMARKLPHIHFVEIDLPGVVDEKLSRLQAANITIPPNIEWQRADLGVTTLAQVLDQRQVTVTTAEGLMPYFTFTDIERIAHYACESLASGGLFVCDVGWGQSLRDQPDDSVAFINRQTGSFLGLFESIDHIRDMFSSAGYAEVTVLYPSKFIPMPEVLQPVIDGELIVAARKA